MTPVNPWLEDRLEAHGRDGLVLDLGSGRGFWMAKMVAAGLQPIGIELDLARAATGAAHLPVAVGEGAALPFADCSFSLVWCVHVLHHTSSPLTVLDEIRRVLVPGGHLILAETVEDHPAIRLARRVHPEWDGVPVRSRFSAEWLLGVVGGAGLDVIDHRQHSLVSFAAWTLPGALPPGLERPHLGRGPPAEPGAETQSLGGAPRMRGAARGLPLMASTSTQITSVSPVISRPVTAAAGRWNLSSMTWRPALTGMPMNAPSASTGATARPSTTAVHPGNQLSATTTSAGRGPMLLTIQRPGDGECPETMVADGAAGAGWP